MQLDKATIDGKDIRVHGGTLDRAEMTMASTTTTAMASTPPHASTDSLASSGGSSGGSNGKESRFNRLIHRLHGSNSSRDLSSLASMDMLNPAAGSSNPSTPQRYHAASSKNISNNNNSPALSDIDDIPLERPVFESKFMRELQEGHTTATASPRPPLAPSYSSPAAVISHTLHPAPNNNNHQNHHHHQQQPSSRELERTRSSPIATSPSSSSSSSLKSRLVRVASSNSLFAAKTANNATSIGSLSPKGGDMDGDGPQSPSYLQLNLHRKTASLASNNAAGPSPSPRSRLAASVANNAATAAQSATSPTASSSSTFARSHAYRHSEDVRQYSRSSPSLDVPSSAYGKNHASSPPLSSSSASPSMTARAPSPNLHALQERENEDGLPPKNTTSNGMFSGLSVSSFSLNRKRSVDGLSLASNVSSQHLPIPEDEEEQQDNHNQQQHNKHDEDEDQTAKRNSGGSIEQKTSSSNAQAESSSRPPLGERYLSSDRLPLQDGSSTASSSTRSTTPGFPRHMPSASYSSTYTNPTSSSLYNSTATNPDGTSAATSTIQGQRTGLISSGLSESSRRFRSAFRLNKSRAAGMATPGGGGNEAAASLMGTSTTTRRAMRVPLKQQMGNEDENEGDNEENNASNANAQGSVSISTAANSTASPKSMEVDGEEKGKP